MKIGWRILKQMFGTIEPQWHCWSALFNLTRDFRCQYLWCLSSDSFQTWRVCWHGRQLLASWSSSWSYCVFLRWHLRACVNFNTFITNKLVPTLEGHNSVPRAPIESRFWQRATTITDQVYRVDPSLTNSQHHMGITTNSSLQELQFERKSSFQARFVQEILAEPWH